LLLLFAILASGCPSLAGYDQRAYQNTTSLKAATLSMMAKRWNLDTDSSLWIIAPDSVSEIGCIHTCHGAGCGPRRPSGPNLAMLTSMDMATTLLTEISKVTARERRLISCYHEEATTIRPEPDKLAALIDTVRAVDAAGVPYAAVWRWAFSRPFSAPPST
jgi:hypothetical protein